MPPRSRRQTRIRPISQKKRFKTRRERIQHLRRMQDVARIRIETAIEKAEKDSEKLKKQIENLQTADLTPEEFQRRMKGLKTKIDNLKKEIIEAQKRAKEWRDRLREEGEEIEEPFVVDIVKTMKTLYICWRWYSGHEYSSLINIKTEEALPAKLLTWTYEAGDDIDEQISSYIDRYGLDIIAEIVARDNAQRGTLSLNGIEEYWSDGGPSSGGKTGFATDVPITFTNDELAEKNGFIREGNQYVEE